MSLATLAEIRATAEAIGALKERWGTVIRTLDHEEFAEEYTRLEGRMAELQNQLIEEIANPGQTECSICRRVHGPEITHACE
jgi:hypothetical protein